ncbi:polysaccharide biosynthesis protein [Robertkochia aurantiaca]|uniref:polysaccharide biosynthesis protein n=1 Tax=Robertkochia aurantiaca TaxID=2873700 RepID=UPI001CCA1828|nr:nucleoside-diphosphate sugar epimerase/dehydratase [Robertkochia sp. 3YJGBD-33]
MTYNYPILNTSRYVSKWLVLVIDITIVLVTFFLVYYIRFDLSLNFNLDHFYRELPLIAGISLVSFLISGSYKGVIRYTGFRDLLKLLIATGLISVLTTGFVLVNREIEFITQFTIPKSIIILHAFMTFVFLASSRLIFKAAYKWYQSRMKNHKRILIYGAGDSGIITQNALIHSYKQRVKIVGFVDDDRSKTGNSINGTPIYHCNDISTRFIEKNKVNEIIFAIQKIEPTVLRKKVDAFIDLVEKVKIVPPVEKWIDGELHANQIKQVQLEDLLGRAPIEILNPTLQKEFKGRTVLVTGAAGSIGSEISRQLGQYSLKRLILLDIAESSLYDLQQEFIREGILDFEVIVGDIRDAHCLNTIFEKYRPEVIFHAAAYKHVPLMEENPYEAVKINVFGTRLLAESALKYGVDKFVLVSTDKAVNPTNVMGATKRTAEIYIGALQQVSKKTKFITTRFGNVLGSNGSVIPLFRKQLEKGGPLTVTHEDVTRYFMTIPEASQLVLEAGSMGEGGEIFIFDMGEKVKIFDLAKNLIRLSGFRYPEDIDIRISGLRPGEKLYEELLANGEDTMPTYHEKIMISKVKKLDFEKLKAKIEALCILNLYHDKLVLVRKLKEIVPEFVSNNSVYESLDEKRDVRTPNYAILHTLNINPHTKNV